MDVHKPKPVESWRDFAKEIGIIVLGIVIALGLEQAVDVVHHRMQAHDMTEKLRQESLENRAVIRFDLEQCTIVKASITADLTAVSHWLKTPNPGPLKIAQVPEAVFYKPADSAWITIRDSSLLPIMSKRLVDNGWKIDATDTAISERREDSLRVRSSLRSLIATTPFRPITKDLAYDLLTRLNDYQEEENRLCYAATAYSGAIESALAGKTITMETNAAAQHETR